MKRFYSTLALITLFASLLSAQVVTETVSTDIGYTNQVWYSLSSGEMEIQPKNNWDIAFDASGFGTSVMINSATGAALWVYPGSWEDFETMDTTGLNTWSQRYNADTSWAYGAFSRHQSGLDVGWGIYNTITHIITGDSLYVLQLTSGEFRKLRLEQLASGIYTFRQATLDNTLDITHELAKSDYSGKNFGYFDLQNQQALDREPASADWDLLFGQYLTFLPAPYNVAGVLHNVNTEVVQAYPVNDPAAYTNYDSHTFVSAINTIGYDWKQYTGNWSISDSLVYFVKTQDQEIWKMVFTGFGGSANGEFEFTKELIFTSSVDDQETRFDLQIYPNPATHYFNVIFDQQPGSKVQLTIQTVSGKEIHRQSFNHHGLASHSFDVSGFNPGIYLLTLQSEEFQQTKKIIIQ